MLLNITAESQKHSPTLISAAETACKKFKDVLEAFSECHTIYNGNVLNEEKLKKIGKFTLVGSLHVMR